MVDIPQETGRSVAIERPCLYLVATPIGNLGDITLRALDTLRGVDVILAEDTRTTRHLLAHYQISGRLQALHQHNEQAHASELTDRMRRQSLALALVSDAGMPLVSDPGFPLVTACLEAAIEVRVVPGASAVLTALAASGLPLDRFAFEGFLPTRQSARRSRLQALRDEPRTVVLFEAPHRIFAMLEDMKAVLGPARRVCVARELTKLHETFYRGDIASVCREMQADPFAAKGELVLVVAPAETVSGDESGARLLLRSLLKRLSRRDAVEIAGEVTGWSRNRLYDLALTCNEMARDESCAREERGPD